MTLEQYDKLSERLRICEIKISDYNKFITRDIELSTLFENQRIINAKIEKMEKQLGLLLDSVALLTRIENGRS